MAKFRQHKRILDTYLPRVESYVNNCTDQPVKFLQTKNWIAKITDQLNEDNRKIKDHLPALIQKAFDQNDENMFYELFQAGYSAQVLHWIDDNHDMTKDDIVNVVTLHAMLFNLSGIENTVEEHNCVLYYLQDMEKNYPTIYRQIVKVLSSESDLKFLAPCIQEDLINRTAVLKKDTHVTSVFSPRLFNSASDNINDHSNLFNEKVNKRTSSIKRNVFK